MNKFNNCFICYKKKDENFILEGNEFKHAIIVLKKEISNKIVINYKNKIYNAEIINILKCKVICKKINSIENSNFEFKISAIIGLSKKQLLENTIIKLTELGINTIYICKFKNSIPIIKNISAKIDRWNKIILSSIKQSKQNNIPKIYYFDDINALKKIFLNFDEKLFCYENEAIGNFIGNKVNKLFKNSVFAIGPEGGFTKDEYLFFKNNKFKIITLGNTIFKCDTAAIITYLYLKFIKN